MNRFRDKSSEGLCNLQVSRRECLRLLMSAAGLYLALPCSTASAVPQTAGRSILEQFLGEALTYEIGFWLFPHCGEASTRFLKAKQPGLYRASMEGRSVGVVDLLMGRYRYSYVSYLELSPSGDRLRPLRFELTKKQMGKKYRRTVTFDYSGKEITFSRSEGKGESQEKKMGMEEGIIYEDYLTLFYNFRHGCYGPLERGRTYHLPLHIHEGMKSVDLSIATHEEEERHRQRELNKVGKDFFLQFRVNEEDVSSTTGKIEGWLSRESVPVKGTIKDVILFGDLWGSLIQRKVGGAHQRSPARGESLPSV